MARPKITIRVEGLTEAFAGLDELTKPGQKKVVNRILVEATKPMAMEMQERAPKASGKLSSSVQISQKLSSIQTRVQRQFWRSLGVNKKLTAEVNIGPEPYPYAHMQEFGTVNHGPQAYVRPAWDAWKMRILETITALIKSEVSTSVARSRAKKAKKSKKAR